MSTKIDRVSLEVGGKRIEHFSKYRIESDMFTADDAFSFSFDNPGAPIGPGMRCRVRVNGVLELNGIIDRVGDGYKKSGTPLSVSGRDFMGLLVDSHVGQGKTDKDIELKALARDLLKDVPFINRKAIVYGRGNKLFVQVQENPFQIEKAQREPGTSIFETLRQQAVERGVYFWCRPDGTLVFSRPVRSGKALFSIVNTMDGRGNNVVESDRVQDISQRYSQVTVLGQAQGEDFMAPEEINRQGMAKDSSFPFHKPYYTSMSQDMADPVQYAALVLNQQRFAGFQLSYTLAGHSQGGRNWQANVLCRVRDAFYGYDQNFLVYSRIFSMEEGRGRTTTVKLSKPGVLPS